MLLKGCMYRLKVAVLGFFLSICISMGTLFSTGVDFQVHSQKTMIAKGHHKKKHRGKSRSRDHRGVRGRTGLKGHHGSQGDAGPAGPRGLPVHRFREYIRIFLRVKTRV